DLGLGDALADQRVGALPQVSSEVGQAHHCALEARRVGKAAPLEAEGRHRRLPTLGGVADKVAVLDHRIVQEDLAELAAARELPDPAHLYTWLLQVDDEVADALVRHRVGVGPSQQETAV